MPPQRLRNFGTMEPPPKKRVLTAGDLTAEFSEGGLGAICFAGLEVLRGISFLVRDENWGTCRAQMRALRIKMSPDSFTATYRAQAANGSSELEYSARIKATRQSLVFSVRATPLTDFSTNRTGFVVLHPLEGVAGQAVSVTHVGGSIELSRFPKLISPGQPFFNIRALEHKPAPGLTAHVLLEGDKFEMEDQRNWGDASYKTYVCSLLDPWPYVLKSGQTFEQAITLTISGRIQRAPPRKDTVKLATLRTNANLPGIGLALSASDAAETLRHIPRLRELNPKFLTCLYEAGKTPATALQNYVRVSHEAGIPLRMEIVLSAQVPAMAEMAKVADAFHQAGLAPQAIIITHTRDLKSFQPTDVRPWGPSYEEMASAARFHFPHALIGGGMISFFTELNRKRPPKGVFDFLTHSLCPIVHDASDSAVMQTLETLPHIFASAHTLFDGAPYHLGPSTIAARMNPYGSDVASNPHNGRVCLAPNDPRQFGEFAAVWTLGLLVRAAQAGLSAVTLGSLCGPRGLINPSGETTPLFSLLRDVLPHCGSRVHADVKRSLAVLEVQKPGHKTLWLANTGQQSARIELAGRSIPLKSYGAIRRKRA